MPVAWLDLEDHVEALVDDGLTVLPASLVAASAPELADLPLRLLKAVDRLARDGELSRSSVRNGVQITEIPDLRDGDPAFGTAARHPVLVALAELRLGRGPELRSCAPIARSAEPGGLVRALHCDAGTYPSASAALSCMWLLTEHDVIRGTLCYVPGTHRLRRAPGFGEGLEELVPLEAAPGSVVVFDGLLWHGTWPRSAPGRRLAVHYSFVARN